MTIVTTQCADCANFDRETRTENVCLAFPDGIPEDILDGTFDHTQPHEGDNGIQYEPRP